MSGRHRILIADDELNLRRVLAALLLREGYDVLQAADGVEAVAALDKGAPVSAVITDLKMPRMDGMALLRHLVAYHPRVPVILITAHGTVDLAVEALKGGAFDFITKPFEQSEMRQVVQKAVRIRSTREGPLSHITTYVPADVARRFGRRELARKPILLLLEEAGVKVGRAVQTVSARLADAEVAAHLDLPVGSALLAVRRLIYDEQERPVQWLHGLYRPDRYEYQMQLSRVGNIDAKVWVSKDISAQFH